MKVERDSDTKYRGKQLEEDCKAKKAAFYATFLTCFLPLRSLVFCTQLLHPSRRWVSTRKPEFLCVHAGVSWLVGKYTSALRRRALRGMDHGVMRSTRHHNIHTYPNSVAFLVVPVKLDFFSQAPGKECTQPHGWSQVFGFEFQSGSSASGCDAQQSDNRDIPKSSALSPQANIHASLHTDPSTSAQANLPTLPAPEGVLQVKGHETVEAEMSMEFSKPSKGRWHLTGRYYPFPSLVPFSFISMERPDGQRPLCNQYWNLQGHKAMQDGAKLWTKVFDLTRAMSPSNTGTGRYDTALSTCTSQAEYFSLSSVQVWQHQAADAQQCPLGLHRFLSPMVCAPELRFEAIEPSGWN